LNEQINAIGGEDSILPHDFLMGVEWILEDGLKGRLLLGLEGIENQLFRHFE
jgi:hypothetical protein